MGSASPQVPSFDFTKAPRALEPGTKERNLACHEVREALEEYGCMLVRYDHLSGDLRDEMFRAMQTLFDLPVETKRITGGLNPLYTYVGPSVWVPLYETLAVMNADAHDESQAFTDLVWPTGNESFCKTLRSMSEKMKELAKIMMGMVIESYGVGDGGSCVESTNALLRMAKYSAPNSNDQALGLVPHCDTNYVTVLCQNGVDGILLKTRGGEWIQVNPEEGWFVVFIGETLRAWSNGRLYCPLHKVMITGDTDRYSTIQFLMPKEEQVIKAPDGFVDDEHPHLYKPFRYKDFLDCCYGNPTAEGLIEKYAGIASANVPITM